MKNRWSVPFMGKRRGLFQKNQRRGRMGLLLTLVAVAASAVWYNMTGNQNTKQKTKNNQPILGNTATETAFAEELLSNVIKNNEKQS